MVWDGVGWYAKYKKDILNEVKLVYGVWDGVEVCRWWGCDLGGGG